MHIAQVAPAGVEKHVALMNDPAADEDGCGQRYETEPDVLGMRHQRRPLAKILAVGIGDDGARQRNFNFGIRFKKVMNGLERTGQVLFVTVEIREDVALRTPVAMIDGVIHAAVLFDERANAAVMRQPVLGAVVRTGILHDVLQFDALLVGNRSDTKFKPARIAEARRDDGEFHGPIVGKPVVTPVFLR